MENLWILFIIIYGILKGTRDGMKKFALRKSSSNEILFFYTLIGFILTIPFSQDAFLLDAKYIIFIFIKSGVVCTAWLFSIWALKRMSVSLYGIMDTSRMVFSTMLGVFVLGEDFTLPKAIGVLLVITGLILVNLRGSANTKGASFVVIIASILNCFFNAVSGTMDKVLMRYMSSSQLQFWFMLFSSLIYGVILLIRKEKVSVKCIKTNYWIPIMSASLIIGDRLLFIANASPQSEVTLMTVIKQSSVIVSVLMGYLIFKEKHILYKLFCAAIVLSGILIAILM